MSLYDKLSPITHKMKTAKNLLAFSGGPDSVALFFILLKLDISFDIAIIHYHTRKEADDEINYAKQIAQKHNKKCFIAHAPIFKSNFEAQARNFRFDFFDEIISTHHYDNLVLAHQLNDRFEWLVMQLTRGSGLHNLLGFEEHRSYPIIRPLEFISKDEIYAYCKEFGLKYFEDTSNQDLNFKRNYFRHHFCTPLIQEFASGIAKSLSYLQEDKDYLSNSFCPKILHLPHLTQTLPKDSPYIKKGMIFAYSSDNTHLLLLACDKIAKQTGYILSAAQRREIKKANFCCKIHQLIIAKNTYTLFIVLDIPSIYKIKIPPMSKIFKNLCATNNIPPKLRAILWNEFCAWREEQKTNKINIHKIQQKYQEGQYYREFEAKMRNFFTI